MGRGEFYDQEVFEGRTIFVRYVWSGITKNSAHFEQSFSDDGGKTLGGELDHRPDADRMSALEREARADETVLDRHRFR